MNGSGGVSAENFNDCSTCVIDLTAENVTVVGNGINAYGISTGATGSDGIAETGSAVDPELADPSDRFGRISAPLLSVR